MYWSILLSACCTNFSTSNGSRVWRPNIIKELNLAVLETLVLVVNKAPLMKSFQSFSFSSMPFLRMSSYCFRAESDILSLTFVSLYPDPIGCKIGKKSVWWKGKRWKESLLISPWSPFIFRGDLRDSRKYDTFSSKLAVLFDLLDKGLTPEISGDRRSYSWAPVANDMCSIIGKHVSPVICVPLLGKHISLGICVRGNTYHCNVTVAVAPDLVLDARENNTMHAPRCFCNKNVGNFFLNHQY